MRSSLENDLSAGQQNELWEIIEHDPEKQGCFELITKMRLTHEDVVYRYKKNLIKITPAQKVIRLSLIGLGIAASFALIILTTVMIPGNQQDKLNSTARNILVDSTQLKPIDLTVSEIKVPEEKPVIIKQKREDQIAFDKKKSYVLNQPDLISSIPVSPFVRNADNREIPVAKVPVYTDIVLKERNFTNTLVTSNLKLILPAFDDERSKLSKFIARIFREKILKENYSKDSPLKAYEIAEAGVAGLNKLLGWEMALEEKKNVNGEMISVSFSSKILKFNAPVKNTEPLQ
jgi:hypothetical protein